jgi:hypothetical protein
MAQPMLMSTSVNGGRALPSPQAGRPARPMLPLRPSYYNHARSVSVRTMALFGKTKTKAAPAKKVRVATNTFVAPCARPCTHATAPSDVAEQHTSSSFPPAIY